MALARVVTFDKVDSDRMAQMQQRMQETGRPDDVPASEILVLHDPEAETSTVILFFENEDDYAKGDAALSAMPASETPGNRSSVTKHNVVRMTA